MMSSVVDLEYISHGSNNSKTPIIFLHGSTVCKEHWRDIPKLISAKVQRKVYVIDARNHGDSPWTDEFNFDMNADDLLHFMDKHNIERATLVGHSMGGITSMKTALKAPHRVDKIVSEDIGTGKLITEFVEMVSDSMMMAHTALSKMTTEEDAQKVIEFMLNDVYSKMPEEAAKNFVKSETMKNYENILQLKKTSNGTYTFKSNVKVITAAFKNVSTLVSPYQGSYTGPAFFIYGSLSDFKVGDDKENIKKHFPAAEFLEIKNATHDVHTDQQEDFMKALVSSLLKN